MSGYVLSADADLDLDEIWEYIAADNLDAADRWCSVHELTGQVESYGPSAFIGVHRRLMNCLRELSR